MRTARSVALGLALASGAGSAMAQPSSWSQSCGDLTRHGLPAATVRMFHDAMTDRAASGATPPKPTEVAQRAAQVMRRLPIPMIVGVLPVSGRYDPRTNEVTLHVATYSFQRAQTPDGREIDETVTFDAVAGTDGKITRIDYRMTVIEDRKIDHAYRERPGQPPRADGGRWQEIGLAARKPIKMPGAGPDPDKGFGLTDDLHLVVAGSPRPPFTTAETFSSRPVCQGCTVEQHQIRTVHVTPVCAAIVKGRTGRALHIIQ
ncbi:hypothetical protein [Reyranella sp. CPCC 100927]|uniref:hypothetical protein n=1 Tax=Reyranella sp. CPCC 100927 TaxID=2599616 RepID=UPI0011B4ABDA|nr:hypothetical protein [Reyranella sp. CPCC 100927]TWS94999.1 hypothetical protein FQU96_40850 [Reyranella sp. CPCC 100927]